MLKKTVVALWFVAILLLFFYSFVQVDLGLTLNRVSIVQVFEKSFQYIGYFNRPLSTYLFISIITFLFLIYLWVLNLVRKKKLETKTVWVLIIISAIILMFSYNAFSYDLFNYIFDAKIVTHYHQNPYIHKALDYPGDPMLGFMHWTHRTYPYGPLWLGITIPLSFLGGGIFVVTFYLFKLLATASFLICSYFIYKISKITKLMDPLFAVSFFALNPFVLSESLVSAHLDIVMLAFSMAGVYFLFQKKNLPAWVFLILSILIKFATGFLAPVFIWFPFSKRKNKELIFIIFALIFMLSTAYIQSIRTTFQPWYVLLSMPFAALISKKFYILIPAVTFSFLVMFQYVPYFYTGNYNPPIPYVMNLMLWWSMGISLVLGIAWGVFVKIKK